MLRAHVWLCLALLGAAGCGGSDREDVQMICDSRLDLAGTEPGEARVQHAIDHLVGLARRARTDTGRDLLSRMTSSGLHPDDRIGVLAAASANAEIPPDECALIPILRSAFERPR